MEGRRTFPFLPRTAPCTSLSVIVNDAIETANAQNSELEMPCNTMRNAPTDLPEKALSKVLTEDPVSIHKLYFVFISQQMCDNARIFQSNTKGQT